MMRWIVLALLLLALPASAETPKQLVDQLTRIDCPVPGVSDSATFDGFIADDKGAQPSMMLVTQPRHCQSETMRELVRRGAIVLPALLAHLGDARPTKLVVGSDPSKKDAFAFFGGQHFSDEYDARERTVPFIKCSKDQFCEDAPFFQGTYTVRVGDICFVLVGQIVNRALNAVRYQPTAVLMVNSPVETPSLAEQVRKDWSDVDVKGLKAALLDDLHRTRLNGKGNDARDPYALEITWDGALRRLRVYYPDIYAGLTGSDLQKRLAFEKRARQQ